LGIDAGVIAGFASPACGGRLQAGRAAPASAAATPVDAPRSRSLRDGFSAILELEIFLIVISFVERGVEIIE
jgi:hypothetical protein